MIQSPGQALERALAAIAWAGLGPFSSRKLEICGLRADLATNSHFRISNPDATGTFDEILMDYPPARIWAICGYSLQFEAISKITKK
jgi:hypothetical protein